MNFNDQAKSLRKQIRYLLQLNNSADHSEELASLMTAQARLYEAIAYAASMGMVSFDSNYVDAQGTNWTGDKGEN